MQLNQFSFPIFVLCIILFFLPFTEISCSGGMTKKKITGTQLAFGFEFEGAKMFYTKKDEDKTHRAPEIFALIPFLLSILGAGINLTKIKFRVFISGISSFLIILFLLLLKEKIESDADLDKIKAIIEFQWPFWSIIVLSGLNLILNLIPTKKSEIDSK